MDAASLARAHQAVAGLLAGLVLVMAALASQWVSGTNAGLITTHGWVGNGLFLLVLANLGLVVARKAGGAAFGVAVALVALTFAQTGLGYVGREQQWAVAWHVTNGVLLMGLTTYQWTTLRAEQPSHATTVSDRVDA